MFFCKRSLTIAVAAALTALPAAAQTSGEKADSLETVIVTGTRVTDRTVAESASPIDIITPAALEATGTIELATALSRVLPSLNFPRPAISDGTDAVKPAQLRGLAPDQVLVLVNGKRRHTTALINLNDSQGRGSSPVDLNAIPIASIARVEVLRDGASAQYGSDAIAGVVNIVLKGSGSGGGIAARYGQYTAGDGDQYQLSGDTGFVLGERGFLHLAGQAGHNDQTDRARPYTGAPGPAAPPYDKVVQRYGDPEIDQGAVSYNGEFGLGERAALYSFGAASNRDVLSNGFFRPAGDPRNIPQIYPNGFLPNIHNVAKDRSLVAGVRGTAGSDWSYDLSYNYGYNKLSFDIENTLNRSLGPTSPQAFYAGSLEVTQNVANLDVTKPLDIGLAYPVTFAFGAERREEKFNQGPGELGSYVDGDGPVNTPPGAQVFPGFKPEDAGHRERNSNSLYADFEADLTDRFSAGIAGRYEDYSDFGTTTSGKLSARYAFTDAVALRGTVSTGFRAPSLQQQYFQSTATNFIGGVPFDVRTFAVDNPTAIALGAEPLQAEESTNYGLGLVLSPAEGLYVTIDAYRIDIDDRIILSENLIGPAVTTFLETRGIFGVTGGRYFTNAVDTKTTGIDIIGTYKWTFAAGEIDWTAGYNYSKTKIEKIAANPPELTAGGLNLQRIGRVEQGRITVGAPRDKVLLGGVWKSGDWSFSAMATRYGEFSALNASPALDQTFGAKWTIDVSASYQLGQWNFALGGDNIFDAYPDEYLFATSNGGQLPYPRNAPFGFNGAFVYGKVGYTWE
ncbi:iron complex outermembrane receptor protein [Tahibacter aquaticus]|uniref:Iron complex outermembrane receptor protein n=1 Tax=Tahibacter aquaticus TaxID=520092 RepID=A0A4R6YUH3_9GAMM|nr:TonB-dependent receptor [Tahibacter aquaticus]TDR41992.1 iron complex outermembrane receptor protein [Tahibacter aquaticus]